METKEMHCKEMHCTCVSAYQDEQYGPGLRVHNRAPKANKGSGGYRCTVCGHEKA